MVSEELSTRAVRDLSQNILRPVNVFTLASSLLLYRFHVSRRFVIDKEGTSIGIA